MMEVSPMTVEQLKIKLNAIAIYGKAFNTKA